MEDLIKRIEIIKKSFEEVVEEIKTALEDVKKDIQKINEDIWGLYLAQDNNQEISSANTARIQTPRTVRYLQSSNLKTEGKILLDIGCGIGNERLR